MLLPERKGDKKGHKILSLQTTEKSVDNDLLASRGSKPTERILPW
jgi:hypothetical protein